MSTPPRRILSLLLPSPVRAHSTHCHAAILEGGRGSCLFWHRVEEAGGRSFAHLDGASALGQCTSPLTVHVPGCAAASQAEQRRAQCATFCLRAHTDFTVLHPRFCCLLKYMFGGNQATPYNPNPP